MKLNTQAIRYLSGEDWRVLTAVLLSSQRLWHRAHCTKLGRRSSKEARIMKLFRRRSSNK